MKNRIFCLFLALLLLLCACSAQKGYTVELAGNATTGYQWQLAEADSALTVEDLGYTVSESENGMVGVGGVSRFSVCPQAGTPAGIYTATFLYYRAWEGPETAVEQAAVTVTVAGNGAASYTQELTTLS